MGIEEYWQRYLCAAGAPERTACGCVFMLGSNEPVSAALIKKVLSGEKTATTSSLHAYEAENEPLPQAGMRGVVADFCGRPHCVVEIMAVTVLPFDEVTAEMCAKEGEDADLCAWRQVHEEAFTAEGKAEGFDFSWDMPVVFVEFRTVFPETPKNTNCRL